MYSSTLLPDFRKLHDFVKITDDQIHEIERIGGVEIHLDYMNKADYERVSNGLNMLCNQFSLQGHETELLYLILKKNEQIRERYHFYMDNYDDDLTSREVAKFLLAYKTSNPNQHFHITAKPMTGSVTIKDTPIARWMAELIYSTIEKREFPLAVFGEKILQNLFGDDWAGEEPIKLDTLRKTANLSPRKPTVRLKKLYVELCLHIQIYLINQTHLTAPSTVLLTDAQANFFFEVLELLGFLNREKIDSEPNDYIHAMFKNNVYK